MNCPTKDQILDAAKSSKEAHKAITKLFPEVFQPTIKAGEMYSWGTSSDGCSGLVIRYNDKYLFVNFLLGRVYLHDIDLKTTKDDLNNLLSECYLTILKCKKGGLTGPYKFRSWLTKPRRY